MSILAATAAFLLGFITIAVAADEDSAKRVRAECAAYAHALVLPDSDLVLCWRLFDDALAMRLIHPGHVWIGVGFGRSMANSDAVIGRLDTGQVIDAHMRGRTLEAVRSDPHQDITEATIAFRDGTSVLEFKRALDTKDAHDQPIAAGGWQPIIWAVGSGHSFGRHIEFDRVEIDLRACRVREMEPARLLVLHALIMVASWGLLSPILLVLTRFYKVTPRQDFPAFTDNPFWFRSHRLGMTAVVVASTVAAGIAAWTLGGLWLDTLHGKIGAGVIVLGWCQQVISYLRGTHGGPLDINRNPRPPDQWFGDHYNMTLRRRIFEAIHIPSGYLTAIAGVLAVLTGFFLFRLSWHWYAAYGAFLLAILALYWKFTRDGRHIRTYVAIWGPSPEHPGNRP